jgi:hypothetical protein
MGDQAVRAAKANEYWNVLPEISQLKRHQRLEHLLAALGEPANLADEWRPFRDMLLTRQEAEELQTKYPKKVRQPLEQKWSFFFHLGEVPILRILTRHLERLGRRTGLVRVNIHNAILGSQARGRGWRAWIFREVGSLAEVYKPPTSRPDPRSPAHIVAPRPGHLDQGILGDEKRGRRKGGKRERTALILAFNATLCLSPS